MSQTELKEKAVTEVTPAQKFHNSIVDCLEANFAPKIIEHTLHFAHKKDDQPDSEFKIVQTSLHPAIEPYGLCYQFKLYIAGNDSMHMDPLKFIVDSSTDTGELLQILADSIDKESLLDFVSSEITPEAGDAEDHKRNKLLDDTSQHKARITLSLDKYNELVISCVQSKDSLTLEI